MGTLTQGACQTVGGSPLENISLIAEEDFLQGYFSKIEATVSKYLLTDNVSTIFLYLYISRSPFSYISYIFYIIENKNLWNLPTYFFQNKQCEVLDESDTTIPFTLQSDLLTDVMENAGLTDMLAGDIEAVTMSSAAIDNTSSLSPFAQLRENSQTHLAAPAYDPHQELDAPEEGKPGNDMFSQSIALRLKSLSFRSLLDCM